MPLQVFSKKDSNQWKSGNKRKAGKVISERHAIDKSASEVFFFSKIVLSRSCDNQIEVYNMDFDVQKLIVSVIWEYFQATNRSSTP